jgi:hypothetical protein
MKTITKAVPLRVCQSKDTERAPKKKRSRRALFSAADAREANAFAVAIGKLAWS